MTKEINKVAKYEDTLPIIKVLSIHHLYKSFETNHVLIDFNLELEKGESVVVLGKSGSGKSVLIKCIIGLLKADKGSIVIFEKNMFDLNENELDRLRAKVGFLFQSNALYDSMTVKENLEFPLRRHWLNNSATSYFGLYHCLKNRLEKREILPASERNLFIAE